MTSVVSTLRMPSSWQKPSSSTLTPGRVDVGQLGQVADAHHHLGVGIAACAPRGSGPATRRSRSRSAPARDRCGSGRRASSGTSTVASSPSSVPGTSGTATTSQPQSAAASRLVRLTLRTSSAPAFDGLLGFLGIEAVDRDAQALRRAAPRPRRRRRPRSRRDRSRGRSRRPRRRAACFACRQDLGQRQPRGVVDLGEDVDVVACRNPWRFRLACQSTRAGRAGPSGPLSTGASPQARRSTSSSPLHSPGRTTRSTPRSA